jgi:hypothetical protein
MLRDCWTSQSSHRVNPKFTFFNKSSGPVNQVIKLIQNSPFSTGLLKSKGKNLKFEELTEILFFLFVEMERSLVKTPLENQGFHKTKVHNYTINKIQKKKKNGMNDG